MGPDEPVNAVLGEHSSMSITVLDKEATGSLVLPAPPTVVSLADYDQLKVRHLAYEFCLAITGSLFLFSLRLRQKRANPGLAIR